MKLSLTGELAEKFWNEIPKRFTFVSSGAFVVMPNHIHGILIIEKPENVETQFIASPSQRNSSKDPKSKIGGITGKHNPMLHETISQIIRWYKGRTTFEIRKFNPGFSWQARFHDHIIRDEKSFERIREYNLKNPEMWQNDKFFFRVE